jgi:hypothetical protein
LPLAYNKASKQYLKHLVSYQLLPFSLARLSEPSSPAFARGLICVFFPALADKHKLVVECGADAEDTSHWAAADELIQLGVADAATVCRLLSTALADGDERRQLLCHQRLFRIAIESGAVDAANKHLNPVRKQNKADFRAMVERCKGLGIAPERKAAKKVSAEDKRVAEKLRADSVNAKRCFSLGFLESCGLEGSSPNPALSQLLRVAESSRLGPIKWGVKCECGDHSSHNQDCWWAAAEICFFLETRFFHLPVHQMWVEGAFNILSLNHNNSSPELMEAKLEGKMNNTAEVMVPSAEINRRLRVIEKVKLESAADLEQRRADIHEHYHQQPTKQRQPKAPAAAPAPNATAAPAPAPAPEPAPEPATEPAAAPAPAEVDPDALLPGTVRTRCCNTVVSEAQML